MDFGDLKKIIDEQIIRVFDHALVLNENHTQTINTDDPSLKLVLVPYQPTCEMLLVDFRERIQHLLPEQVQLHSLRLNETATSYAEWYADDNL